jgi:YggT family protein
MVLLKTADVFFWIYLMMLFARILGSWIPEWQNMRFMQFIAFYTDPYLNIFRRIIPPLGMLDLSPIAAFFCLNIIEAVVKQIIVTFLA